MELYLDSVNIDEIKEASKLGYLTGLTTTPTFMLRFSHWLKHRELPKCCIVTGSNDQTALQFAKREHFNGVFINYTDKKKALGELSEKDGIQASELGFFFR